MTGLSSLLKAPRHHSSEGMSPVSLRYLLHELKLLGGCSTRKPWSVVPSLVTSTKHYCASKLPCFLVIMLFSNLAVETLFFLSEYKANCYLVYDYISYSVYYVKIRADLLFFSISKICLECVNCVVYRKAATI